MVRYIISLGPALLFGCLQPPDVGDTSTDDTTATTSAESSSESSAGSSTSDPPDDTNDTSTSADPSTTCVLSFCGDGSVRKVLEECDDQNNDPADGCHTCYRTRRVFITSESYQGAQFMGLAGADQRCRSLAAQAGLMNAPKFKAWLSDSQTSAKERLHHARGRYELINGLLVADNWDALVAGNLVNPINVTEKSETFNTGVFTSTNPDGSTAEGTDHCADWTAQELANKAFWGASSEISADWTIADSPVNPQECGSHRALYCFEQ
jgi:cysteine-rich repeat protein